MDVAPQQKLIAWLEALVSALLNPSQPNDALQAAALRYKQVKSVSVIGDRIFS